MKLIKRLYHYVVPLIAVQILVDFSLVYPLYQLYTDNGDLYGYVWKWIPWFFRHFLALINAMVFYYVVLIWSAPREKEFDSSLAKYYRCLQDCVPLVFFIIALFYRLWGTGPLQLMNPLHFWINHLLSWITMVLLGLVVHRYWSQKSMPNKRHAALDTLTMVLLLSTLLTGIFL